MTFRSPRYPTPPDRAEDKTTPRRDPSANPGTKTRTGGRTPPQGLSGIGPKAINPLTVFVLTDQRSEQRHVSHSRSTKRTGPVLGGRIRRTILAIPL